jgi:hypothetical protein
VKTRKIALAAVLGLVALAANSTSWAQSRNEVGLVMGATITPSQSFSSGTVARVEFDPSLAMGVEYDRFLFSARGAAVYAGGDLLASPHDVKISNPPPDLVSLYAYLFLTPHVRVKFNPQGDFSPWLLFGGGYARFLESAPVTAPAFTPGTNKGTLVFGGGIDTSPVVRVFRLPIGFRIEVRDFYSGLPNYIQTSPSNLQHHIAFTGGLLVRF